MNLSLAITSHNARAAAATIASPIYDRLHIIAALGNRPMNILRLLLVLALAAFALPAPALAQEPTDEDRELAMEFAMHDAIFTLYHEAGHLLVGELGLPVLGKEEDAADALAVILILKYTDDEVERFNTLIDAADGWYFNAENSTGEGIDDLSYYDDHSLDIQRAYAMVCMMVGADPAEFGETADIYEMDPDRQEACGGVYQQAETSWITVLDPHFATEPGADIPITYDEPGDYEIIAENLKDWEVMENLAELLRTTFALPGPVTLRVTQCGQANAYYDPSAHEITYCYELAASMYNLYLGTGDDPDDASYVEDEPSDDDEPDDRKASAGSRGG
jgi:hypothetical protein